MMADAAPANSHLPSPARQKSYIVENAHHLNAGTQKRLLDSILLYFDDFEELVAAAPDPAAPDPAVPPAVPPAALALQAERALYLHRGDRTPSFDLDRLADLDHEHNRIIPLLYGIVKSRMDELNEPAA